MKIRRKNKLKRSETKKSLFWLSKTTLLRIVKRKKVTKNAIIVKKKVILLKTILIL